MPVGPGDRGLSPPTRLILDFCRGNLPARMDCTLNLVDVRDAHGSGQTPVSGTYFTDASKTASAIQTGIQDVSQAAGTHWHGESGDIYQAIAKRLTT